MCQPKAKGGARCAIHHHGTQAAIQTTTAKTNLSQEDVQTTFSSLNKEGKKLENPSREEFESYLEKERFVTEIDPQLSERDKRMILKKIEKAKTENTPNGGTFHAWKNLMGESLKRYGRKLRTVGLAVGVAGTVMLLGGCAAGITDTHTSSPTSSPSSSSQPSGVTYGDVIVKGTVTDAYGSYESTTIDPNDPIYKTLDTAVLDPSLKTAGWSDADVLSAQQWTVKFLAEQGTDSTALDGTTGWADWQKTGSQYVTGPFGDSLITDQSSATDTDRSGIIWNNPNGYTPVMVRDGKPRVVSNKIGVSSITNFSYEGKNYIQVKGVASTKYRVTDAAAIAGVAKQTSTSEADVKAKYPLFQDGKNNVLDNDFTYSYTLAKKGDSWGIVGYNTDYRASYEGATIG